MSEKKRKRREEGSGRPKKKVAIADEAKVQVELLEHKEPLGPTLATTPGLNFPSRISFTPYKRTTIHPDGAAHHLLLQSSEHARLDYVAQEEPDGSSETQLKDYIGVFDPATNKLQMVPVQRVVLRSTLRSETEEMRAEAEKQEARQNTMMAKRHALAAEFGSKKSRKAIDDMTLNAIRSGPADNPRNDAVADNILQNMEDATSAMPTKEELATAVDSSKPRPTPNMAAEYPGDVYPIETVVGSELMTMLEVKDWVEACRAGKGINVNSRYVAKRILSLATNKQIQKLKVLRFVLHCMDFAAALSGPGGNRPKKIPMKGKLEAMMGENTPVSCVMAIRRKFAPEGSFEMPRWNIDNLMTHIAAAALIVDEHEVDVSDLRDDLKIDNKAIQAYFSELGCRVSAPTAPDLAKFKLNKAEANNHYIAKLKLPLKFPKVGGPRKSRK